MLVLPPRSSQSALALLLLASTSHVACAFTLPNTAAAAMPLPRLGTHGFVHESNGLQVQEAEIKPHSIGQTNNNNGWMWMAAYWSVGAIVSAVFGYAPSSWKTIASPFTPLHAISTVITVSMTKLFLENTTNFDRSRSSRSILASIINAAFNGTFETIMFFAAYDVGAVWLSSIIPGTPNVLAVALGVSTFSCYSGLIHVLFWLPKAFPAHRKPGGKPFYVRGLPELSFISASWLAMYTFTKDIAFVCVLHFILNFYGNVVMGLQLPSLKQKS